MTDRTELAHGDDLFRPTHTRTAQSQRPLLVRTCGHCGGGETRSHGSKQWAWFIDDKHQSLRRIYESIRKYTA